MTTRTTRTVASIAFAATAALGLAACSPPHEQDSAQKVDTATSQNPDSLQGEGQVSNTETTGAPNVTGANASKKAAASEERAAATAASDGTPLYVSCETNAEQKPATIVLNCKDKNDVAENISWDDWSDEIARGTATRVRDDQRTENAQITLSTPKVVDGVLIFTKVTIDGTDAFPQSTY